MTARPSPLGYAPGPGRSRRWRRRIVQGIAFAIVGFAAAHWGPQAWRQVTLLYWQRQCLAYQAPAGQVICVETEAIYGRTLPFSFRAPNPAAFTELSRLQPFPDGYGDSRGGPILFLHERRPNGGRPVLVVIHRTLPHHRESVDIPIGFDVTVIEPATLFKAAASQHDSLVEVMPNPFDPAMPGAKIRFFAGKPDPQDESRFTIEFELAGRRGIIDGVIQHSDTSPDSVSLEVRGSPGASIHRH